MSEPRCDRCVYWQETTSCTEGDCRRYAPLMNDVASGLWPKVDVDDWCGDFKQKETSDG